MSVTIGHMARPGQLELGCQNLNITSIIHFNTGYHNELGSIFQLTRLRLRTGHSIRLKEELSLCQYCKNW